MLLLSEGAREPGVAPGAPRLSARERELITLVAQGRTNAQIAGQLFISVRTVSSHLDRIRDKTGCRRRTDLTRLALQAGLVYCRPTPRYERGLIDPSRGPRRAYGARRKAHRAARMLRYTGRGGTVEQEPFPAA